AFHCTRADSAQPVASSRWGCTVQAGASRHARRCRFSKWENSRHSFQWVCPILPPWQLTASELRTAGIVCMQVRAGAAQRRPGWFSERGGINVVLTHERPKCATMLLCCAGRHGDVAGMPAKRRVNVGALETFDDLALGVPEGFAGGCRARRRRNGVGLQFWAAMIDDFARLIVN